MGRKRLGEVLLELGFVDEQDLSEALRYQKLSGYRLGTALMALRMIAEWQLTEALGKALGVEVVDLSKTRPTPAALKLIPQRLAERFDLIPLKLERKDGHRMLVIAMSDPLNRTVLRRMREVAGCPVKPVLAGLSSIQRAIRESYSSASGSHTLKRAELAASKVMKAPAEKTEKMKFTDAAARNAEDTDDAGRIARRLASLEIKFRSLLHLLLKSRIITEKDYASAVKHMYRKENEERES